jgi:hypothetical protein
MQSGGALVFVSVTSPAGVDCTLNGSFTGCQYHFAPGTTLTLTPGS